MTRYIIRRALQAIPLLLLISVVVFALANAMPSGLMAAYENNPNISKEDLVRLQEELGLNTPAHIKYLNWLGNTVRGDLGYSLTERRPVTTILAERIPNTIYLTLVSFIVSLIISIPIGILSARRQYSIFDHMATGFAFIGQSIPIFWFGLILIIVFNVLLKNPVTGRPLLPGGGMYTIGAPFSVADRLQHLILPVAMLSVFQVAQHMRYMRSSMLDVIHQDYIRTARAKGLRERAIVYGHALKNALLPVVTVIGLELPTLVSGAFFTETIFSWPGMGRLFVNAAGLGDYTVLMAIVMLSALLVIVFNLLTDITYAFLDPRIQYS
ncbi:MAG: ABC transporter permease [Anaerolineae bacterium]|nr:ABC transporter permease [Anaerolineae bacterium]